MHGMKVKVIGAIIIGDRFMTDSFWKNINQ